MKKGGMWTTVTTATGETVEGDHAAKVTEVSEVTSKHRLNGRALIKVEATGALLLLVPYLRSVEEGRANFTDDRVASTRSRSGNR